MGAGTALGLIDNPIQRERHTEYPMVAGSGLKGAVRHHFWSQLDDSSRKDKANLVNRLFGPETDASEFAGAVSFGDAQLVAFPVRCVKGAFVYATSPTALARAARALALVEANPAWPATTAETGHCKLVNPTFPDSEKREALKRVTTLNDATRSLLNGLRNRQKALADDRGDSVWRLPAQSTAPFMTGLGNEHPLENGFAFLNPYGLPYLPGSGVKGVLRRAAENLVCGDYGDAQGWSQQIIDALFGRETASGDNETSRNRGALMFWDVIPEPAGGQLAVDIMTPHYGDYYQGNATPHDSGQPNPILFLTVPPNSSFEFFVQCDLAALPESLKNAWQTLLESAFRHAFDWLGFGAKMAVGYGAMRTVETVPRQRSKPDETRKSAPAASEIQGSAITAPETGPQRWENAALSWNKGKRELYSATAQGKAFAGGKEGMDLREKLSAEQRNKLDKGKSVTATLIVERIGGNNWRIVEIV